MPGRRAGKGAYGHRPPTAPADRSASVAATASTEGSAVNPREPDDGQPRGQGALADDEGDPGQERGVTAERGPGGPGAAHAAVPSRSDAADHQSRIDTPGVEGRSSHPWAAAAWTT